MHIVRKTYFKTSFLYCERLQQLSKSSSTCTVSVKLRLNNVKLHEALMISVGLIIKTHNCSAKRILRTHLET